MPVTCEAHSAEVLYDWNAERERHEYWFAVFMMIVGLDPMSFPDTSIDEHVSALRQTYNSVLIPDGVAEGENLKNTISSIHPFVNKQYKKFIYQVRVRWQELTICRYLETL
jgi:hypothetical protein